MNTEKTRNIIFFLVGMVSGAVNGIMIGLMIGVILGGLLIQSVAIKRYLNKIADLEQLQNTPATSQPDQIYTPGSSETPKHLYTPEVARPNAWFST